MYYLLMIQIESDYKKNFFRISLSPNRSLSWKSALVFTIIISSICLSIGFGFALAGASLILPFAGLEVFLVSLCIYLVLKKTYEQEIIYMTPEKLKIEKGSNEPKRVWEYFRLWSYIIVEKPKHPWYPAHILITSQGERVPIGEFLSEEEKKKLVIKLEKIIHSFK